MMLPNTPKASRLHIGIAGRMNVGKSSFLNMLAGQDVAITSAVPGTTTDVVEDHGIGAARTRDFDRHGRA